MHNPTSLPRAHGRMSQGVREVPGRIRKEDDPHDHCALNNILKLAHVSGPIVVHQAGTSLGRNGGRLPAQAPTELRQKVLGQQRDIFATLPQRRHSQGNDIQPVVQVLPEKPCWQRQPSDLRSWRRRCECPRGWIEFPRGARTRAPGGLARSWPEEPSEARRFHSERGFPRRQGRTSPSCRLPRR
jgi:hypothetical protein